MDNDRIEGAAREAGGKVQSAAGSLTGDRDMKAEGDMRSAAGKVQGAYGSAKDAAKDAVEGVKSAFDAEHVSKEVARLRQQVEELMRDRVTPMVAGAASTAGAYVVEAKDTLTAEMDRASEKVKANPLTSVAVVGFLAFVLGRLTSNRS
jgi:uncharacterized protein YjbJ (UPF0337 family)